MKTFLRFTLRQTVFINLAFVLLMIGGVMAVFEMPVERYPNINFGKVVISTFYPGASPADVENLVTRKIEDALEGLGDVEFVRSTSYREWSSVMVKFIDDTDYQRNYDDLRFQVLSILEELPENVDPPVFDLIDVNDWQPVVSVNLIGNRGNRALSLMGEDLKIPLSRLSGVDEIRLQGEYKREFHILLDPSKLEHFGITFDQVANALQAANVSVPAGDFNANGQFSIVVDEKFRNRENVVQTIVRRDKDGSFVRLGDLITRAELSHRDPTIISSVNGKDCVTVQVIKTAKGNALTIMKEVEKLLAGYAPVFEREGVQAVLTQDSTVKVRDSMRTLGSNLLLGIGLVFVLIWMFMGFRNAALTTLGIPFAFLCTMVIMYLTGNSFNEISLFSFVLVSGIIVDDAIMVVENIYRHLQMGKAVQDAVVDGTAEVFLPVISATLTTVAAFLPMLIMTGSTGEFFAIIPKAVSYALLASVLECLIILPSHYVDFGPSQKSGAALGNEFVGMVWIRWITDQILSLVLRFRVFSLVVVLAAFIGALYIFGVSMSGKSPLIRIKFFPDDYSLYYINLTAPLGTTIEELSDKIKEVSSFVMADGPGKVRSVAGFAGFYLNEDYEQIFGETVGHLAVTLPSTRDRDFDDPLVLLDQIRKRVSALVGAQGYNVHVRAEKDGPPTGKDINVRVMGSDMEAVNRLSADLLDFLKNHPVFGSDLVELTDNQGESTRVFKFDIIPERASEYGLSVREAAYLAASVLGGRYVGTYRAADEDLDIKLKMDPDRFSSPDMALRAAIVELDDGPVRLAEIAVHSEQGSGQKSSQNNTGQGKNNS